MKLYGGIDLHSNNHYLSIIDENDNRMFKKRLKNDLRNTLEVLEPFKQQLVGIAVESTFNWYWLVDGLMDAGYKMHLVNTSAVKQYEGLKHTDDKHDAFWLSHLLRLGILPTGYIYPKEQRPIRDLLRKRLQLVGQRTTHVLSVQNQYWRNTGVRLKSEDIKRIEDDLLSSVDDSNLFMAMNSNLLVINILNQQIETIEKAIQRQCKLAPEYKLLKTVYGVGVILALTIMLETGEIGRFPTVGDFASYSRCVDSRKTSNGKKKGEGNSKCGNKYLAWAFVEAAHFATRYYDPARRFFQRKQSQRNAIVAIKALAHKLARASYYVMRDQVPFKPEMLFR
jgi:transposase